MSKKPTVVCLCGSSKWPDLHMRAMMDETLAGRIVIPMGLYGHADFPHGAKAATNDGDESTAVKQMLDTLHHRKIDAADEILVITVGGYIGNSTKREIEYAKVTGKRVRFLDCGGEQPTELVHLRAERDAALEQLRKAEAERDEARRALKLECQDWADDDTRVKAIAAEFGIKDCEDHDAFKGVIDIAAEMAVKIREAEAERDQARKDIIRVIENNREFSNAIYIGQKGIRNAIERQLDETTDERDAANALVDRLAGVLEKAEWVLAHSTESWPIKHRVALEATKAALAEIAKSLSPRTTENTKPQ